MKYRVFPAGTIGVLVAVAAACAMPQREFVSLCRDGSLSEVSLALQSGDVSPIQPAGGVTPLMAAASARGNAASTEKIRCLVDAGSDVAAVDKTGMTALMYAARFTDKPEVLRALIDAGSDVKAADRQGWTALSHAAAKNYESAAVMELIDAGSDVNAADRQGVTPLMLAFRGGVSRNTVLALLNCGAGAAQRDRNGRTALDYLKRSALNDDAEVVQAMKEAPRVRSVAPARFAAVCRFGVTARLKSLMEAGTDPEITVGGLTPLMWAARDAKDAGLLKALIEAGVDVNARDPEGRTALMYAAGNSGAALKTLLNGGAQFDCVDRAGKSACDYAVEMGKISAEDLLPLKAGMEVVNRAKAEGEKRLEAERAARTAERAAAAKELKSARSAVDELKSQLEAERAAKKNSAAAEKNN